MVQGCPRQHVLEIDREQQLELCPSRTVTFSHAEQSDVAAQKGGCVVHFADCTDGFPETEGKLWGYPSG